MNTVSRCLTGGAGAEEHCVTVRKNCTVGKWRRHLWHMHTLVFTHTHTHTNTLPPTAPKTPPGGKVHVQLLSRPILWMLLQEKKKEPHTGNKTHSPPQSLQIHEGTSYRTWRSRYPQQAALPKQTSRTKRDQPVLAPGPDPETKDGWMYGWM